MRKGKNLMQKLKKCIFLSASNVSNAYKLFNPPTKMCVANKDAFLRRKHVRWYNQKPKQVIYEN